MMRPAWLRETLSQESDQAETMTNINKQMKFNNFFYSFLPKGRSFLWGIVVHTFNPSTREGDRGRQSSEFQDSPGPTQINLVLKRKKKSDSVYHVYIKIAII